jgi:2-keto-4-pentenoate hydratase/2-oxohepta-3-ene-1,7-dioic acid hydratase in catechol pathway
VHDEATGASGIDRVEGISMKLISFVRDGQPSFGCVTDKGVIDLGRLFAGHAADLRQLLERGLLPVAREHVQAATTQVSMSDLKLLPVIPSPGKILCVGLNYHDHVIETGRAVTAHPTMFLRTAESQAAHGDSLLIPAESSQLDYEGEIALVIGKRGRRIARETAREYVAGYSCYNDGSVRDWQATTTQWTAGKNFPGTGAFGPWLVTADEIPFGTELELITRLNGDEVQRASTAQLIHGFADLIAHVSTFATLEPGDVLVTGTPGGVGFKKNPPVFLRAGDAVEVEVSHIGKLRNTVECEVSATDGILAEFAGRAIGRSG